MTMKYNGEQDIWVAKYRPQTIEDCILPKRFKDIFQGLASKGTIPHLLLSGEKGLGKTSVGLALCEELGVEVLFINASKDRGIDVLRSSIVTFASGKSLTGKKKVVFLDEADRMTELSQNGLKGVMEDERILKNCRFILTCNHPLKIIPEIHSRCSAIPFTYTKEDNVYVATKFMKRIKEILELENIKYDMHVVAEIIKTFMPDFRRVINELELLSVNGEIPANALVALGDGYIKDICELMKAQEFTKLSEWVFSNTQIQYSDMIIPLYRMLSKHYLAPNSIPSYILIAGEVDTAVAMGTNESIQKLTLFIRAMSECDFK